MNKYPDARRICQHPEGLFVERGTGTERRSEHQQEDNAQSDEKRHRNMGHLLCLGRPVFDVLRSNVRVAVLDQVPSTHADHEQAADRAEPTTGISCEPRRYYSRLL